jgi:N6-L-threonylcarbamoyladenine synthase/protein kinase Bud32
MAVKELVGKGAEADIYRVGGTIRKERIEKKYRAADLDLGLRSARTKREARLVSLAKRAGVPTPVIYDVDNPRTTLTMSHVEGVQVKKIVADMDPDERKSLFKHIGTLVGRLHSAQICHGDLTTSNMLLKGDDVYFIDFGLGEVSVAVEDKGVDLLVFKKAVYSTHYKYEHECLEAFFAGYTEEYPGSDAVLARLREIEKRGRYFVRTSVEL